MICNVILRGCPNQKRVISPKSPPLLRTREYPSPPDKWTQHTHQYERKDRKNVLWGTSGSYTLSCKCVE